MRRPLCEVALVTGASSGIGREIALLLAERGWDLVITGRNPQALEAVRESCAERRVYSVPADLSQPEGVDAVLAFIEREGLTVDLLVNNAGSGRVGEFAEMSISEQLDMVGLNVISVLRLSHALAAEMTSRGGGYILNVASTAGFSPGPLMSVYYATKAFDYSFSMAIGEELRRRGIRVSAVCPGPTRSGFDEAAGVGADRSRGGRLMDPRRVAVAAIDGLLSGKALIVPGLSNKLSVFATRLLPRSFVVKFLYRFNASKLIGG